jgi:hypothetical protein
MPDAGFLQLLGVALGSGLTVKLLDIGHQQLLRRSERSRSAKQIVDQHLDPLLKAADEVVGKLRSMAERDFGSLRSRQVPESTDEGFSGDLSNLSYLIARFWAQVEILKLESLNASLSRDRRGAQLGKMLDCLESQRVRILDRAAQRAIGEAMIFPNRRPLECIPYIGFVEKYRGDPEFRGWVAPLVKVLRRVQHTEERQRLLQYGVVLHALIDTLDGKHRVTKDRPSYTNKLTRRSRRSLRYRVFGVYLNFVRRSEKYWLERRPVQQREKGPAKL